MARSTFIDPTALVHAEAQIERGVMIWNWTKVRERALIGEDTNIGQSCYIDFDVSIGARCKIQNGVSVYHGVQLGDDVFVGPNATFTNDLVPRAHKDDWSVSKTEIGNGASIGANATIICGTKIGTNAMIAAGAIVTKDVPDHALVMGTPAVIVDYVTRSGRRLGCDPGEGAPAAELLIDCD